MSNLFELKDSYQQVYDLIAEQEDEQILKILYQVLMTLSKIKQMDM